MTLCRYFFFPLPTGVLQSSFVIAKTHVDMEVCEGNVSRWEKKKRQDLAILETLNGAGHGQKTAVLQPYRAIGPRLWHSGEGREDTWTILSISVGWFGWTENVYQNQNFEIQVSPWKKKGKQTYFLLGFSLFRVLIPSSSYVWMRTEVVKHSPCQHTRRLFLNTLRVI